MTNQEIIEAQRRHKRLSERAKIIVDELIECGHPLMNDAAEVIKWLQEQLAGARRDLNEEIREEQRSARDAYEQGKLDQYEESKWR